MVELNQRAAKLESESEEEIIRPKPKVQLELPSRTCPAYHQQLQEQA